VLGFLSPIINFMNFKEDNIDMNEWSSSIQIQKKNFINIKFWNIIKKKKKWYIRSTPSEKQKWYKKKVLQITL
jgi:hypothetical protein